MKTLISSVFTKSEKKLIKQLTVLQLESLNRILKNDCENVDIPCHCLENEIDPEDLTMEVARVRFMYEKVLSDQNFLFNLHPNDLKICRSLLRGVFHGQKGCKRLLRKIKAILNHAPIILN